ncbi:GHKL domain-containing protein [Enterococcus hulanensis]|nr:GHKL domain-containing protein [Enterococcus hulanensis]
MQQIVIDCLMIFAQVLSFYFVYWCISKTKFSIPFISIFFINMLIGNAILGYYLFIPNIICLYIHGYITEENKNKNLLFFYSVYSIFSTSLFGYFFVNVFNSLNHLSITIESNTLLLNMTIIPILAFLCNVFLIRIMRPSLLFLESHIEELNQGFLLFINIFLSICCTLQFLSYWIEVHYFDGDSPIREYLVVFFVLTIMILLRYLNTKTRELDKQRIQELKDNQLADLTSYVQQIEAMYGELRGFRHDYHNVLISLNESIKTKDLSIIQDTYNRILNQEGIALDGEHYSLARLNNLKTLPIKGIFSTHIIQAWQKNIPVNIEIDDVIQNEAIDILDYVRIASILLDNAIEAAEKAENPFLTIVFLRDETMNEIQLIIENSCPDEVIDITKIFKKDYSTKGENRGLGLATVQAILQNYTNLSLQTEYQFGVFRQVLMIKEEFPQ